MYVLNFILPQTVDLLNNVHANAHTTLDADSTVKQIGLIRNKTGVPYSQISKAR
jgi:hypothetical protein